MENLKQVLAARTSFLAYVRLMEPKLQLANLHYRVIQQYQALADGYCLSSQVHVPPQSGTTTLALLFMAFLGGYARPDADGNPRSFAYVSGIPEDVYFRKVRSYMAYELHQLVFPRTVTFTTEGHPVLNSGPVTLHFFSALQGATGCPLDGIVFDAGRDALEVPRTAQAFAANWLTRATPKTFLHLQGCRWSKADWYALAMQEPRDWNVLIAPALVNEKSYWPALWPVDVLQNWRHRLFSPEAWAAQFMQQPIA